MSLNKLPIGKVSKELLIRYVFTCLGSSNDRVIKGPNIGEDAAIIDFGDKVLIAKANPITGAVDKIGWLAVHINANDVAARGAEPLWYLSIVLLPEGSDESILETIMREQNEACSKLGICIVGGHTEVAPNLGRPIVAGFMLGEARKDRYITTGGAQIGDHIVLTKGIGLEGTGILSIDLRHRLIGKVPNDILSDSMKFLDMISVVPEARLASGIDGVHSMHTPTEGGLLNGLIEISEASGYGFKIREENLLIHEETSQICKALEIDPLRLLSSGSLLIVIDPRQSNELVGLLEKNNILSMVIGEVIPESRILIKKDGSSRLLEDVKQDELFRILEETT
jgi:hydrogenase maturation factor